MTGPKPGWYPDPSGASPFRWWDGSTWTTRVAQDAQPTAQEAEPRPAAAAAAPSVPAAAPAAAPAPTAPAASATPAPASPAPAPLPSRRSLRAASPATAADPRSPGSIPVASAPVPRPAGSPPQPVRARLSAAQPTGEQPAVRLASAPQVTPQGAPPVVQPRPAAVPLPAQAAPQQPVPQQPVLLPPMRATTPLRATPPPAPAPQVAAQPRPVHPAGPQQPAFQPGNYVPLNPLATTAPGEVQPTSPPGFQTPAAWIANAPVPVPTYANPATAPFGGPSSYRGSFASDRNSPARAALTVALLCLVVRGVLNGLVQVESFRSGSGLLVLEIGVPLLLLAAVSLFPLGIAGLVRASRLAGAGRRALGRAPSIIAMVIACLVLGFTGVPFLQGVANGIQAGLAARQTSATGAAPAAAVVPQVAVAAGDGTYTYNRAQAQASIGAAYAATLKAAPKAVSCPATASIQVSVTFTCSVTLAGGEASTAQVTIVDAQGHVEVQAH
ncbi:hypothetical protein AS850_10605 [Frondihabitans sp. 762G35]|nr:hypothetical protein AS850_10605 [Frondihabitans sp. 762G35]